MNKDKFIAEKLEVEWHEELKPLKDTNRFFHCSCGSFFRDLVELIEHIKKNNPDFTSEAGRVKLLKLITGDAWDDFMAHTRSKAVKYSLAELMRDDFGLFRNKVYKWLGGEE